MGYSIGHSKELKYVDHNDTCVYYSTVHNSFIQRAWIKKIWYIYNGILFNRKEEWNPVIYSKRYGSYVKWNKPDTEIDTSTTCSLSWVEMKEVGLNVKQWLLGPRMGEGGVEKGWLDLISAHCMHVLKYHNEPYEYVQLTHINQKCKKYMWKISLWWTPRHTRG